MTGYPLPLVAWTGGDVPPKGFRAPEFLAMRRALFAEQLRTWRNAWGDRPQLDTVRTFWRRARFDAWRSYSEHTTPAPWRCEARAAYRRVAGLAAFNVRGAVRTLRNQHATAYVFSDGSRFVVGRAGWHRYVGTDGLPYAERIASAVAP